MEIDRTEIDTYVLAIGEALIDAISHDFIRDLSEAKLLDVLPGGSPANFCRFLSACDTRSKLVAAIGEDGFSKILIKSLEDTGVKTEHIQRLNDHLTSLIIVGRTKDTPDFSPYRDADKYLQDVDEELVKNSMLVHSTAFALSHEPARGVILKAFKLAQLHQIPVSVDWNYSEKIWANLIEAQEVFKITQSYNPILKFSMDDLERFTGVKQDIDSAKSFLGTVNARALCLTCGSDGAWYKAEEANWSFQEAISVEVKDATGAGDAFWAGFISEYVRKKDLADCVITGAHLAARRLSGRL